MVAALTLRGEPRSNHTPEANKPMRGAEDMVGRDGKGALSHMDIHPFNLFAANDVLPMGQLAIDLVLNCHLLGAKRRVGRINGRSMCRQTTRYSSPFPF